MTDSNVDIREVGIGQKSTLLNSEPFNLPKEPTTKHANGQGALIMLKERDDEGSIVAELEEQVQQPASSEKTEKGGNPDASEVIQKFHHQQLGRAITISRENKEIVVGYILPVSEEKHFVLLKNGKMFALEPSFKTESGIYGKTFTPNESSITLGEWATSVDKAQEYITHGDFWKVVLSNDKVDDLPKLYELMDQAILTAIEQKDERKRARQESMQELTDRAGIVLEESNVTEITTQSSSKTVEEQKPEETKKRLSKALTKLKDGVHNYFIPDIEKLRDRDYTQEELLKLVKEAEAEVLKEKLEELEERGISPTTIGDIGTIDIDALAQTATELTENIQQNEDSFSEIVDKEKKGEKIPKEELLSLWKEKGELMDSLYEIQWKQRAYTNQIADKAMIALMQQIFKPVNSLLIKMWKSLNKKNPFQPSLSELRSAVYVKTRKAYGGEWGLQKEIQCQRWKKYASPSELAHRVTELQLG